MSLYQKWNNAIFKHYFNKDSISDIVFFCVDRETINFIGKSLGIIENIEDSFCSCVLEQILEKNNKDYYKLSTKIKNNETFDGIPFQTSIIAFFIYIASRMGENPIYRASNFWSVFMEVVEKYYKPFDKTKQNSYYDFLFLLFEDFKNRINNLYDIEFDFPSLFKRKDKRDFVGLPIFQSMISTKDRCILTQKFYEYKNKYSTINNFIINNIVADKNYSNVFKRIRDNDEYKPYLLEYIDSIIQNWDGTVYEFDNIKKQKKSSIIPLTYQYLINSNCEFKFYITTPNVNKYGTISFEKYTLSPENPRCEISIKNDILKPHLYEIKNIKLKIARTQTEYILFKKDPETNLYNEVTGNNSIKIGDQFSVLAPVNFFCDEDNKLHLESVISSYDSENSDNITDGLFLLHGAVAENYDNKFVKLDQRDKITIRKGLKSGLGKHSYIKGAEPLIEIKNISSFNIDEKKYYINPIKEYGNEVYKNTFDIRKVHNSYGKHTITLENTNSNSKSYEIVPIKNIVSSNIMKECIYNIVDDNQIKKAKYKNKNNKVVFGAYLENFEYENKIDNQKLAYILSILKLHKNKRKFPIPLNLKNIIEKLILNDTEFNKYLVHNEYIDNYIYQYLKNLKEVCND